MRTLEEKKAFYKNLRNMWTVAKQLTEAEGNSVKAIIENHGLEVSITSFILVRKQMEKLGLDGIPYVDMKTFSGWRENGFKVKKGEKSKVFGVAWKVIEGKEEEDDKIFPKVYYLFHKDQVEKL